MNVPMFVVVGGMLGAGKTSLVVAAARRLLEQGRRVGVVTDTSHGRNGRVTALLVRLDNNRSVWIDVTDVRYNRADRVVMTNLDRNDLRRMADQRL